MLKIFLWGVFLIAQGGSKDFKDMVILRLISGAFEAVAKPAFSTAKFRDTSFHDY